MAELFLPVAIMVVTIVVATGCVLAARAINHDRDQIMEIWLEKHRH